MQRLLGYFLLPAMLLFTSLYADAQEKLGTKSRPIRLGVMLPLHENNGEGQQMLEYYRGVLMACDSLKKVGLSVEVSAWNVTETTIVSKVLDKAKSAHLDLLIGPFYSNKVQPLSDYAAKNDVMLVLPFPVTATEVNSNRHIFQIFQTPAVQNAIVVQNASKWFKGYHPIIIDCADSESTKGSFTSGLREMFKNNDVKYSLTSLTSPDNKFVKAFEKDKQNVVILNSARQTCLMAAIDKLNMVKKERPTAQISMLGYEEWMAYVSSMEKKFHEFDVYVPSTFYTNVFSDITKRLNLKYQWNFHKKMLPVSPRLALCGFDHAFFFLKGLSKYGKTFDGAEGRFGYSSVQTPLSFVHVTGGGYKNNACMFVHYKPTGQVETIKY
jgi:hypothetical protein